MTRKVNAFVLTAALAAAALTVLPAQRAEAYKPFYDQFVARYVADESTAEQQELAKHVADAKKCNVCHDPREIDGKVSKKNRNPYGQELDKLLEKADQKDEAKIIEALETVEAMKPEGSDKTFGEIFKSGKLPFVFETE